MILVELLQSFSLPCQDLYQQRFSCAINSQCYRIIKFLTYLLANTLAKLSFKAYLSQANTLAKLCC
jgi:hypothetical protein